MARSLIVGCGCRGRSLARELSGRGHAVRGTTRDPGRRSEIEAAGAQAFVGDPDRVGTLSGALEGVSVACLLLGSAAGPPELLAALHGTRLEMLLGRMLDTAVRAIVYEASGTVAPELLASGALRVRRFCEGSRIPYLLLGADPGDHEAWCSATASAVEHLLSTS
ncbi:MAG: NAD(P)H-binding protein [Actinomycetota bacterium]|nr:NAD(P)H-binding protein [Actinomycetota bacterium]